VSSDRSFVFQGTVVAVGATTVELVEANDLTAIVRVDRVLRAPAQMEGIVGREITVQLRSPAEVGTSAVFTADGLVYGESMAVAETGRRRAAEEPSPAAEGEVFETAAAADRAERFRSALKDRADEASLVVVGRVTGVLETAAANGGRESEHDPKWAVATVEVDEAVKGKPPKTLEVMYASSEDVMWHSAPKLVVGQRAVMLLHTGAPELEDTRAHAVVSELDVQPVDRAALVAELV
jgi:hypothetical protein